jgi:hypothetical protein
MRHNLRSQIMLIAGLVLILPMAALILAAFATVRAERRMGGHPAVGLTYRAYGA